jgi:predicted nucleic acid-binding protein
VIFVVDASLVTAFLIDGGPDGVWAENIMAHGRMAAPHLLPVEVASVLRRASLTGEISSDAASMAHADLLAMRIDFFPYEPFAARAWELRGNLTLYDAWYVSLAEALQAKLATLDERLTLAPGPRCAFVVPPR